MAFVTSRHAFVLAVALCLVAIWLPGSAIAEAGSRNMLYVQLAHACMYNNNEEAISTSAASFRRVALDTKANWAYAGWAHAVLATGQPAKALPVLESAYRLHPSAIIGFKLGQVQWALGYRGQAIDTWQDIPDIRRYFEQRGDIAVANDDLAEAEEAFTILTLLEPRSAEALAKLGDVLYTQGRWDEAKQKIIAALEIDPDLTQAHYRLGTILLRDPSLEGRALYHFKRTIELDPHHTVYAYANVGNIYRRQRAYELAAKWYRRGIEEFPASAVPWLHWAISEYTQANYPVALSYLGKAELLDPSSSLVYYWKGRSYYALGDYQQALDAARQANALQSDAVTQNLLGDCYLALGQLDAARSAYEQALLLDPNNAHAINQLRNLTGKSS